MKELNIVFIGDVIGRYGRRILKEALPEIKEEFKPDLIILNGENAAGGYGITLKVYNELMDMGINALTMGNHIWDKKEILKEISSFQNIVRPANYPAGAPGKDHLIVDAGGAKVAIINLLGRVFMPPMDDPFKKAEELVEKLKKETPLIFVDIHAEATSEKTAMGWFLDGKASCVIGTHTHVMTADERILPGGTAYLSDAGMVAAQNSIIGMNTAQILNRFLTAMPTVFEPAIGGPGILNAVIIKIDKATGKAIKINRINKIIEGIEEQASEPTKAIQL